LIPLPDPPLQDDVVALRPWSTDDVAAVASACQDPEIPRWTTVPTPYSEDDAREFLQHVTQELEDQRNMAIARVDDESAIGSISLFMIKPGVGEFGYWLARDARGR